MSPALQPDSLPEEPTGKPKCLIPGLGEFPGGGKWQPAPVFLPEKSHVDGGYSPKGPKESDTTEQLCTQDHIVQSLKWWITCFIASGSHGDDLELTVEVQPVRGPQRIICRLWFQNLQLDTADHSPWNLRVLSPSLLSSYGTPLLYSCLENPMDGGAS